MKEAELIERLKRGDRGAQAELHGSLKRRLLATAWHILGPGDADAEDAVQETFLAAFASVGRFEGRSSLYTWMNHICVNQCFSIVRKRKRLVLTEGKDLEGILAPGVEDDLERRARRDSLDRWIRSLEARCAEILGLRFREGLGLAEIRERLRLPMGTVASRLRRCQLALLAKAGKA